MKTDSLFFDLDTQYKLPVTSRLFFFSFFYLEDISGGQWKVLDHSSHTRTYPAAS